MSRLLFVTQKMDVEDAVLGFVHRWIEVLASHFDEILVVCLYEGRHALPKNVRVFSLGKEERQSRFQYVGRFYRYISAYRDQYDTVLVHMNPEYVVLGGLLWHLWGKRVALWYNHTVGTWKTKLAMKLAGTIFHTSPHAFTAHTKKSRRMPAGIDMDIFTIDSSVTHKSKGIYFQGRLSLAKRIHVLLKAFTFLLDRGVQATVTLAGPEDDQYIGGLKEKYREHIASGAISFLGPIENTKTPALFQSHCVSVNLTDKGNYDKTVLESLACGTPVIVSSEAFSDSPAIMISEPDPEILANALEKFFDTDASDEERKKYNEYVSKNHSLTILAQEITSALQE